MTGYSPLFFPYLVSTPIVATIMLAGTPYFFSAILIPFLVLSLAALGQNILTGYAGQLSLGSAAFMAVGAFCSYNFVARVPEMPVLGAFVLGGQFDLLLVHLLQQRLLLFPHSDHNPCRDRMAPVTPRIGAAFPASWQQSAAV